MGFLLDTDVLPELRRRNPDPAVLSWFEAVPDDELFLSVLTVGEIRQGVERLRSEDPVRAAEYDRWLERLRRAFADRVLPVTAEIVEEWGRMNARRTFPVVDGLLGATALVHGLALKPATWTMSGGLVCDPSTRSRPAESVVAVTAAHRNTRRTRSCSSRWAGPESLLVLHGALRTCAGGRMGRWRGARP